MEIKGREFTAPLAATVARASPGYRARAALRRACALAVRAEPLLLLLLIPALPVPQKLLYLGLAGPLFLWVCAWIAHGRIVERTPLDWALALLLAMVGVGHALGLDPEYSLPKVTFLIWGILSFYVITRYVRDAYALRRALYAFLLLGAWMMVIGLFGTGTPPVKEDFVAAVSDWIPNYFTLFWGYSTDPNNLATALAFFVPVQAALLLVSFQQRGRQAYAWLPSFVSPRGLAAQGGALLLALAVLVLTQSRATFLGLLAGLLSLAAWRLAEARRALAAGLVIGGTLAISLAPHLLVWLAPGGQDLTSTESLVWRHLVWRDSLPLLADFPLTGVGVVRLREVLPALYPDAPISEVTLILRETHNHLLEVGVSFGLPALAAYLAVWFGAGQMVLRARHAAADPWLRALVEGLAAGLLAHWVYSLTGSILLNGKVGICLWAALAMLAAAHRVVSDRQPAAAKRP